MLRQLQLRPSYTVELQNVPESHNGQNAFTFRILFIKDVTGELPGAERRFL